jgi:hypothetical protein
MSSIRDALNKAMDEAPEPLEVVQEIEEQVSDDPVFTEPEVPQPIVSQEPWDVVPNTWRKEAHDGWETVPTHIRQEIHKREEDIMRYINSAKPNLRVVEELATINKQYEGAIPPETNPLHLYSTVLNTGVKLKTGDAKTKAEVIADLVFNFGVDAEHLNNALISQYKRRDTPLYEDIQTLRDEIRSLRQPVPQQPPTPSTSANEVEDFLKANPNANNVLAEMVDYVSMKEGRGEPVTLKQAYDFALGLKPEHRPKLTASVAAAKQVKQAAPKPTDLRATLSYFMDKGE